MDTLDQTPNEQSNPNDHQIAMWGHLIGLLSCMSGFWGLFGTIIFYVVNKDKSFFIRQHATQALNFQITYFLCSMFIALLIGTVFLGSMFSNRADFTDSGSSAMFFSTLGTGVITGFALFIVNLIGCVKSALAANKGEMWHNPMAITLIKVKE